MRCIKELEPAVEKLKNSMSCHVMKYFYCGIAKVSSYSCGNKSVRFSVSYYTNNVLLLDVVEQYMVLSIYFVSIACSKLLFPLCWRDISPCKQVYFELGGFDIDSES